jgi:plasmid segregation protein ParM
MRATSRTSSWSAAGPSSSKGDQGSIPKHRIHELKDALYANVKGFQLAGEYAKTLIASESQAKAGTDSVGA